MIQTIRSSHGMAVAPNALAAQSALAVLREGGNAIEAMVAAAATIAVAYPHMNGLGGDAFWLIVPPNDGAPIAIDACGPAAAAASIDAYRERGLAKIPTRGPLAMNTVAGTVGGWRQALDVSARLGGRMPLARLLADAIGYAEEGVPVTVSQASATAGKRAELESLPGFADGFLPGGRVPAPGSRFVQPKLGRVLKQLVRDGLDSYYRGALAREIAADFAAVGALLTLADLEAYRPRECAPLALELQCGTAYNLVPPTQGAISLAILALLERAGIEHVAADSADHIHLCVEATKQAFLLRDAHLADPAEMRIAPADLLAAGRLEQLAAAIRPDRALPWGGKSRSGDTVWMGTVDNDGLAVSFIQSIYHEYGSGVVLPSTGINWQNRGASFSLERDHLLALKPGKKPFHTLNPAAARLHDGRVMVYGTMGGDGQPQTQAAVFSRYVWFGQELQRAVSAPRWLLGRTWGQASDTLKLEGRFSADIVADLRRRGHELEILNDYDETVGHAGAIVRGADGILQGAFDPRSDGCVAAY